MNTSIKYEFADDDGIGRKSRVSTGRLLWSSRQFL
jgi:hypothetical protein